MRGSFACSYEYLAGAAEGAGGGRCQQPSPLLGAPTTQPVSFHYPQAVRSAGTRRTSGRRRPTPHSRTRFRIQ